MSPERFVKGESERTLCLRSLRFYFQLVSGFIFSRKCRVIFCPQKKLVLISKSQRFMDIRAAGFSRTDFPALGCRSPKRPPKFLRDEDLNHPEENSDSSMSMASREVPLPGSVWLEFGEKQPQSVFLCAAAFNFRI